MAGDTEAQYQLWQDKKQPVRYFFNQVSATLLLVTQNAGTATADICAYPSLT